MSKLSDATMSSPVVGKDWIGKAELERLQILTLASQKLNSNIATMLNFVAANDDGEVIVTLLQQMGPAERGTFLLDLEEILKDHVDEGITVWLEPLGDRNSLRNLRGIEVK
jgi:hypothetical protein